MMIMVSRENIAVVDDVMMNFAYRTGVLGRSEPKRYLWTDSFAVCNFLGLHSFTGENKYLDMALSLVRQVHNVLGRHRGDDGRTGWISGLSDEEAEEHPTIGGLRIGKKLPERRPDESFDWNLEWDRDGQYYHYLTKWMHTLNKVSLVTGDLKFNRWAIELAKKAHLSFTYTLPDGRRRMYWKMNIDLTRPLVTSMGQHDPLDGYITYNELQAFSPRNIDWPDLHMEINDISNIVREEEYWFTDDPLGIGELLSYAYKIAELINVGYWREVDLLVKILRAAYMSLEVYSGVGFIYLSAKDRFAFREFGLAIGLKTLRKMGKIIGEDPNLNNEDVSQLMKLLSPYISMADRIIDFWLKPENRRVKTWRDHQDINEVMLATSIIPHGYIGVKIQSLE